MRQLRAAVFIDRDGTLIEEKHHLASSERIVIFPNSLEAVRKINQSGMLAVVITNQSVVARGLISEAQLREIHAVLRQRFAQGGTKLDAIYYCPHHPEEGAGPLTRDCDCRKPKPGMLIQAADELGIDLSRSALVGDSLSDIAAGHSAGTRCVLVGTGYGSDSVARLIEEENPVPPGQVPDHISSDILGAVEWILDERM